MWICFITLLLIKIASWCTTFLSMVIYQPSKRYFGLTDFTKKSFAAQEDSISFASVLKNTAYQKASYNPSYKISATNTHFSNSYIPNNVSEILVPYLHIRFFHLFQLISIYSCLTISCNNNANTCMYKQNYYNA